MASSIQCDNCGATLSEADQFCGECGVPRPLSDGEEDPSPGTSPAPSAAAPSPARPASAPGTGWHVAAIALAVLGVVTCLASVLVFLFAGFLEYESMTTLENWLFSAFCCLLPIGGVDTVLIAAGVAVWYTRLRNA